MWMSKYTNNIPCSHLFTFIFCPLSFAVKFQTKEDMAKIKFHGHPPALVEQVMQAVMILQGKEPTWAEAKSQLGGRQQQRRMKGWIREGNWKERCRQTEPFGLDREEIGSVAKKHRENGRTKVP